MRRSAAPSQLDGTGNVKRPRFAPPFIGSKTTSDSNLTKVIHLLLKIIHEIVNRTTE